MPNRSWFLPPCEAHTQLLGAGLRMMNATARNGRVMAPPNRVFRLFMMARWRSGDCAPCRRFSQRLSYMALPLNRTVLRKRMCGFVLSMTRSHSEAVAAIESVITEIRSHLKRANIDQPVLDIETLAKTIPSKTKAGIGDAKREEVRFLILSGLPHKEIMKRSGVSAGTMSLIRQEVRAAVPLYRNSNSGLLVPFSYLSDTSSDEGEDQPIERTGGPGRTRTCDQTVMSGQL